MKFRALVCSLALALSAVALVAPNGTAASKPSVKITKIPTKTAPYKGKVTVTPKASVSGKATITKLRFTVRRTNAKGKVVRKNAKSAKLAAGTYHLTTTASYRQYKVTTKTIPYEETFLAYFSGDVLGGTCRITDPYTNSEFETDEQFTVALGCVPSSGEAIEEFPATASVTNYGDGTWGLEDFYGDVALIEAPSRSALSNQVVNINVSTPVDLYVVERSTETVQTKTPFGPTFTKKKTQKLVVRKGAKTRTCATLADFRSVASDFDDAVSYGDSMATVAAKLHNRGRQSQYSESPGQILEFRRYPGCSGASISVGFENGYAYTKSYYK